MHFQPLKNAGKNEQIILIGHLPIGSEEPEARRSACRSCAAQGPLPAARNEPETPAKPLSAARSCACSLEEFVRSLGYRVHTARGEDNVLSFLRNAAAQVSAVLLDVVVPQSPDMLLPERADLLDFGVGQEEIEQQEVGQEEVAALGVLQRIRDLDPKLPVIVLSGRDSAAEAVAAMKSGAADYLSKPVTQDQLARVLQGVLQGALQSPLKAAFDSPRIGSSGGKQAPGRLAPRDSGMGGSGIGLNGDGHGSRFRDLQSRVRQIGWSGVPVVIQGETGSGKEVLARELHAESARAAKPFLKLNCAALPSELVESELFGYERGAFTGAFQKKPGMFELADGGTLLLDEIGDMDVRLQAKLLQVLQDQEFRRVGGRDLVTVDVRVLAATHRDLENAIRAGTFREDLYYRLSVVTLHVPPLRERGNEVLRLGEFLIRKYSGAGTTPPSLTLPLQKAMLAYDWPGNVRELENYMRKLVIFNDPDFIASELETRRHRRAATENLRTGPHSEAAGTGKSHSVPVLEQVNQVNRRAESEAILAALNSTHWNRKQAAIILKVDYKSLLYKMKKLGIDDSPVLSPESASEKTALRPETSVAANGD